MLKAFTRSKLFIKAFIIYIVILVVPIYLYSGFAFYFNTQKIENKAIDYCYEEANNLASIIDDQLIEIQTLSGKISKLSWVWRFTADTNTFEGEIDQIRKKQIVDDLQIFIDDNGLISNMIILFPKKDYAISMNGWFSINSYLQYLEVDKALFDSINLGNKYNYALPFSEQLTVQNQQVIWLIHSIDSINEPRAQVVFSINQRKLIDFINATSPDILKNISIYSREDKPVLNFDKNQQGEEGNLIHISQLSNAFGWRYEMIFDASNHTAWENEILVLALTLLCTVILGPIVAFALAYLSYSPLKKMMGRIVNEDSVSISGVKRFNEYNVLENVFSQLKSDNSKMERRVVEYSRYAQNDMLVRLLKGYFYNHEDKRLADYGIKYSDENNFAVFIVSVTGSEFQKGDQLQKIVMAGIIAEKVLEIEKIDYKIIDILDEDIIIIISDCNNELNETVIKQITTDLENSLGEINDTVARVCSGKIEKGILGISKSYHNAKETSNISNFALEIHESLDLSKNLYYPTDWEIQLINNLKIGKEDAALNILDEIRLENNKRILSKDTQDTLYKSIKNTITRVSIELSIDWTENQLEDYMEEYLESNTEPDRVVTKQWAYIYGTCYMICVRKSYEGQVIDDTTRAIMDYINKNYDKASLSLKEISQDLGISQSNASKSFKNAYGMKFYDYTCRMRMEKTKELLKNTDMPVKAICKEVGYENEFSLRRTFQRYEGISISEYQVSQREA